MFDFSGSDYERKVYTALLGKVIGVYLGRPVEGWSASAVADKFSFLDRYINAELGIPLVVVDDDISGTLTFIRALADSPDGADAAPDFYGWTWLNYLIENRTILWWGGMGVSTEHTAYLRLKHGIPSPESGSMRLNGKKVSEQIGAQIFIDAFGMVCPADPVRAATLAARAARVSHDGEAVFAAQVVAAMTAAAFECRDMEKLLDIGVSVIPGNSLIARVHRDVRAWAKTDGDWRVTFRRIESEYGYRKYGGNCHVIPNHALMVMAWSYARNNFRRALAIAVSAGWDTDCNAANVGTVSALVAGLDGITQDYDFRTPFADRVMIPTAEGTHSCSDVLREAYFIASIGRRISAAPALTPPKNGAYFHFSQPGSVHGFAPDPESPGATVENIARPDGSGRALRIASSGPCRVSTPVVPDAAGTYAWIGTSVFYPGMTLHFRGTAESGTAFVPCFRVRHIDGSMEWLSTEPVRIAPHSSFDAAAVPDLRGDDTVVELGFSFSAPAAVCFDAVTFSGRAGLTFSSVLPDHGWISSLDFRRGAFSDDLEPLAHFGKNEGRGFLIAGNRFWRDLDFTGRFKIHAAKRGGFVFRWQGMERYLALVFESGKARLIRRLYGRETVLAECPFQPAPDALFPVSVRLDAQHVSVCAPGVELTAAESGLSCGGCGFYTEDGVCGVRDVTISATVEF